MLTKPSALRDVHGITPTEKEAIASYAQGAIYAQSKNGGGKPFAVRDLFGGENYEWAGTPLEVLFQKHKHTGKSDAAAVKAAGIDLGWLVKTVIAQDKRMFEAGKSGLVRTYRWIGGEP